MTKVAIIYHKQDLDGVASAAITKLHYTEKYDEGDIQIEMFPYNYGEPIPEIGDNEGVVLVDISFGDKTKEVLDRWISDGKDAIWIDHHKTAIFDSEGNEYKYDGFRKVGTAACELAYEYFFGPEMGQCRIIELLGTYDVWNKERFDWEDVMNFQYGARARYGLDVSKVYVDLYTCIKYPHMSNITVTTMVDNGKAIRGFLKEKNKGEAGMYSFEARIKGLKAICMNTTELNSTTFDSIWDEDKYDVIMPFIWTGNLAKFSLYTTKDEVDCGAMAKSLSGGGHAKAAGFQMTEDAFIDFLKTKRIE